MGERWRARPLLTPGDWEGTRRGLGSTGGVYATQTISERMDGDLREALRAQGPPDDQVFVAAYALAHQIKFGEAFKPD